MGAFKNLSIDSEQFEYADIDLESFLLWLSDEHPADDEVFNLLQENLLDDGYNVVSFSDMEDILPAGYQERLGELLGQFFSLQNTPVAEKITSEIASILKSYVYVYSDPRTGMPFYIGKGNGNRVFSHLGDTTETEKTAAIKAIRQAGLEPDIDILRYGLTDEEAVLVEAAAIDLVGLENLSNRQAGHHSKSFGRIGSSDLIWMLKAEPADIRHRVVLVTINRLYRSNMSPQELYEATRGVWRVSRDRVDGAELALAVYQGIVREVYRINNWHPAGTLEYQYRDDPYKPSHKNRWEFDGEVAKDVRDEYVGKSVGAGGQNPVRYINV